MKDIIQARYTLAFKQQAIRLVQCGNAKRFVKVVW